MKSILLWGSVLFFAVLVTTLALVNVGEVTLRWDLWEINTSVSFVIAALIVLLLVWYGLIRIGLWLVGLPAAWRRYRQLSRLQKAQMTLSRGMIAQEESDWAQAEKQLIKSAQFSDNGLIHYLSAAKMADMQQASARRDRYLNEARKHYPNDSLTIGLVEARLLIDKDQDTALVILAELHRQQPSHRAILSEYVKVLRLQKNAHILNDLLPQIRKYGRLSRDELSVLETEIVAMRLTQAIDFPALENLWDQLSNKQKLAPVVMSEYVHARSRLNELNGLAEWIEKAIKVEWDERLVYQYGRIEFGPAYDRLRKAQEWLKQKPQNPVLLLTLGRLACQSQLWGQAHTYYRESITLQPELETFHALAQCYESEGQESQAALVYKQAMLQLDAPKN